MRTILLTILIISLSTFCYGQDSLNKSSVYVEVMGNGLFGSFNYERQLTAKPGLAIRLGLGLYSEDVLYVTVPVGVNYLFTLTKNKSFIDAGVGATWTKLDGQMFSDDKDRIENSFLNFVPSVGYRRHTATNVMWRISLTPIINKYAFTPWVGVSVGKRF